VPDGFFWLTRVPHYGEEGLAYSDGLPLWICLECGAVVDGDETTRHLSWHERLYYTPTE
jgi:hypothetical protein